MNQNILLDDLLAAAGPFAAFGLNALPAPAKKKVAEALENGGWCELRVGLLNQAATVRLMLVNCDGDATELGHVEHQAH